jgi:hypothetical protein
MLIIFKAERLASSKSRHRIGTGRLSLPPFADFAPRKFSVRYTRLVQAPKSDCVKGDTERGQEMGGLDSDLGLCCARSRHCTDAMKLHVGHGI